MPDRADASGPAAWFSADYATARARFLAAAQGAGAALESLPLPGSGPDGGVLASDLAWLGPADASRVLVLLSGVHGVEGFFGSAVQLAVLGAGLRPSPGSAMLLVHALNPWGMAWLRRTDEANVDLNRNFLPEGAAWSGAPALYARVGPLLNPASPPSAYGFYLRAALAVMRYGRAPLTQAIAEGQYDYPRGLFYGGAGLRPAARAARDALSGRLHGRAQVLVLDLHSGLGAPGAVTAFAEAGMPAERSRELARALQRPVLAGDGSSAYATRGGLGEALPAWLPGTRVDYLTVEAGTLPPVAMLRALREENHHYHFGGGALEHPARRALARAACPEAPAWRSAVLEQGVDLARRALAWLAAP